MISVGLAMLNNSGLRKMLHCLLIITVLIVVIILYYYTADSSYELAHGMDTLRLLELLLSQPEIVVDARDGVC